MTNHPRIGIHSTIDDHRKGAREAPEEQTMNMTESVAELFTSNLHYPNGSPVEVVIANTTIGRVCGAQACAAKFRANNISLTLTVTPYWYYDIETTDIDPAMSYIIWDFNGIEHPGAVHFAAALASRAQVGIPTLGIYSEHVQGAGDISVPEDVRTCLLDYATAGPVVTQTKGEAYPPMGSVSMGIAGSTVDPDFLGSYLGIRNEHIDMSEFTCYIEKGIYNPEECEQTYQRVRESFKQGKDWDLPERQYPEKHRDWWKSATEMTIITHDLMHGSSRLAELGPEEKADGHSAIMAGFRGQRQWVDHLPDGDILEIILSTNLDWIGIRQSSTVATENDLLDGASMLLGYLLTNTSQIFSGVRTYRGSESVEKAIGWRPEGRAATGLLDLRNPGSTALDGAGKAVRNGGDVIKPWYGVTKEDYEVMFATMTLHPASTGYFHGGGFSTHFRISGETPVTMCRINLMRGLGPVMQIAEGCTVELFDKVASIIEERINIEWSIIWFIPNLTGEGAFRSVYDVMNAWSADHGAVSYGHIGGQLVTLVSILRISVNIHNIPTERVFRSEV